MPLTREDVRAAIERAGDEYWRALVAHHEDAYPASRPTPGDVSRREAERLNEAGFGDGERWELVETQVRREGEDRVTLVHRLRDRRSGAAVETPPFTNYE
jgi:L-amino acid N-acyltransferase YncA